MAVKKSVCFYVKLAWIFRWKEHSLSFKQSEYSLPTRGRVQWTCNYNLGIRNTSSQNNITEIQLEFAKINKKRLFLFSLLPYMCVLYSYPPGWDGFFVPSMNVGT